MKPVTIKFQSKHLASRASAKHYREGVESALHSDPRAEVEFDLSTVELISSSFADELFGILYRDLGVDAFRSRFVFRTNRLEVQTAIVEAISARQAEMIAKPRPVYPTAQPAG